MPNFKKNASSAMKKSAYKMKYNNSSFPFKESPMKAYEGSDAQNERQNKAEEERDTDPNMESTQGGVPSGWDTSGYGTYSGPNAYLRTPDTIRDYVNFNKTLGRHNKPTTSKAQTFNYNTGNWE
tara:strand:+ start:35 stop:406 length:372 start_codon:yes stop_codon:yes gene_type:complete